MFPVAIFAMKMSIFETIVYTNIGGALGVVIFTFFQISSLKSGINILRKNSSITENRKEYLQKGKGF